MNTSTNTNQAHDTTASTARATAIGFLRHCAAGALLATAFAATGFGFAATAHADDGPPAPNTDATAIAPALIAPWLPTINSFTGPWHVNCGFSGGHGTFQCSY